MFKSQHPVHCRVCGKAIRKWATIVYVKDEPTKYDHQHSYCRYVYPKPRPRTKAECEKLTNQRVLSIKRWVDGQVSQFNEWDGESYQDQFFCSNTCAIQMGHAAAAKGWATERWRKQQGVTLGATGDGT